MPPKVGALGEALAMLVGQALACMQKMQQSGVQEHFSAAMTIILGDCLPDSRAQQIFS
jgi:hypothetical protein